MEHVGKGGSLKLKFAAALAACALAFGGALFEWSPDARRIIALH